MKEECWFNVYKYLLNNQYFYLKYTTREFAYMMDKYEKPLYRIHVRLK